MKKKYVLSLLLPLLCMFSAAAQKKNTFTAYSERWEEKHFPQLGDRQTIYGQPFNVDQAGKNMFVRFGFITCHPCAAALPDYVKMAAAYPAMIFLYISFDPVDDMKKEFSDFKVPSNLYILSMPQEEINSKKLTSGYPSNLFVSADGICKKVFNGNFDSRDERQEQMPYWEKILEGL